MKPSVTVGRLIAQATPEPSGPEAPSELIDLVNQGLNLAWFGVLAVAFFMATYGLGSMAVASRRQQFGGVNEGKKTALYALAGAAGMTVIRSVFAFFGI